MLPNSRNEFTIAIICALILEAEAVEALFDETYDRLGRHYGKNERDRNSYVNGRIGKYDVVLCCTPGMGKGSAAMVASDLRFSYPNIELALLVGICGGAPNSADNQAIFLGDVIISDSVVAYDFGKQHPDHFRRKRDVKDILGRPNHKLRTLLNALGLRQARREFQNQMALHLQIIQQADPRWHLPAFDDVLFESSYLHKHHLKNSSANCLCFQSDPSNQICEDALGEDCASLGCDENQISRRRCQTEIGDAAIHIGTIASADTVMKSGSHRDKLANTQGFIGFEMEGAGVWDNFPCTIIIKGVCDYADSHKNKKWQLYAAATGASAAKTFLEYWAPFAKSESRRQWMVPFRKNHKFVGRECEIKRLKDSISNPNGPRKWAITGLGGVGKTQIALELVYKIRDEDPECSIFWVPCTSQESVEQAYTEIAQRLGLPGETDTKEEVQTYLSQSTSGKWLLIFDNADNEDMWIKGSAALDAFVPDNEQGCTLFTSRNHQLALELTDSSVIQIPEFDADTGVEYLRKLLVQTDLLNDYDMAILLLKKLVFLPLAITQAVAYINKNQISLSTYVVLLEKQESEIIEVLSEDFQDKWRYKDVQNPVATTWWISFQQIQQSNTLAAEYLMFMACVDPRNIPQSLLPRSTSENEQIKAIGLLKAYAFVSNTESNEDKLLNLHRLVYIATRNWIRRNKMLDIQMMKALVQLGSIFPEPDYYDRKSWREYVPHAIVLLREECIQRKQADYISLMEKVFVCLIQDLRLKEAAELGRQLIAISAGAPEVDLEDTLYIVYKLYRVYLLREQNQLAEELIFPYLEMMKKAQESDLLPVGTLGELYLRFGRDEEAEKWLSKAIESLGPQHPDALKYQADIADKYRRQAQYEKAEELYLQIVKASKDILGPDDPRTLHYQTNLISIYRHLGRYTKAEELCLQVIETSERILKPDHIDTLVAKPISR